MSTNRDLHLDENQLLWAVVEEAELPLPLREHLSACPQCRANKEMIEQDLARMGQMAERFSPSPRRRVSLPVEKARRSIQWSWGWRAFMGAAAATALILIITWWSPTTRTTSRDNVNMLALEMQEAEQLMTEVGRLVENALPYMYSDISTESNATLDEEFMQFVIPSVEDETLSYDLEKRGVLLC